MGASASIPARAKAAVGKYFVKTESGTAVVSPKPAHPVLNLEEDSSNEAIVDDYRGERRVTETKIIVETPKKDHLNERFLNQYRYTSKFPIGTGTSSRVFLCEDMDQMRMVAIKEVNKSLMLKMSHQFEKSYIKDGFRREIAVMKKLVHPNIGQLIEVLDDDKHKRLYLVLEYFGGGDFGDSFKSTSPYTDEVQLRTWAFGLCDAIRHCHKHNIVHRDIKTENVLRTKDHKRCALIDFGMSHMWEEDPEHSAMREEDAAFHFNASATNDKLIKAMGTPVYFAPEILKSKFGSQTVNGKKRHKAKRYHGKPVDLWAFGVLLFKIVRGVCPYKDTNRLVYMRMIANANPSIDLDLTTGISPLLTDLMRKLLEPDPSKRITAEDACRHPWFEECNGSINDVSVIRVTDEELSNAITKLDFGDIIALKVKSRRLAAKARKMAATRIQSYARSKLTRNDMRAKHNGALRIQGIVRIKLARNKVRQRRQALERGYLKFNENFGKPSAAILARSSSLGVINVPRKKRRESFGRFSSFSSALDAPPLISIDDPASVAAAMQGPTGTSNWLIKGRIMVGSAPGSHVLDKADPCKFQKYSKKNALCELGVLRDEGITSFLSLQQSSEALKFRPMYQTLLSKAWSEGLVPSFTRQPVVDGSIMRDEELLQLVNTFYEKYMQNEVLYIHCYGGHGRAGTVAACLLAKVYSHMTAEEALGRVQAYHDTRLHTENSKSPASSPQLMQVRRVCSLLR